MPIPLVAPRRRRPWFALVALVLGLAPASAQDHTYSSADIATGVRLYGAQCALCHGANGDTVAGVNLRLGRFRRAVTDDDLAQVIAKGVPPAMPAFTLLRPTTAAASSPSSAPASIRRARRSRSATSIAAGRSLPARPPAPPVTACTAQARCTAPDLSDIGALRTPAALQRALLDPTRAMPPDQPSGHDRNHRRQDRPRTPRQRRHVLGAAGRRRRRARRRW